MTKIRELREKKGLNIIEVSHITRINPTVLSQVERRKLAPGKWVCATICEFFGIHENEAFDSDGLAV